ncbi:polysaccharide deacetylase family protein [Natronococcus sp. A-GB7]|uniref:polysaccharide deacetylase family protein n=1 Tax=Natronococcus sp. A-GB7 TaxID=3037649 RepID=UPI00242002B2|nr:polysaccharide deacetylase family protein [Natronococcus sp. A-GB7]MDG5819577.1 polysaccharide deacetylase family protein [Natronococcus sp. A-GB7]
MGKVVISLDAELGWGFHDREVPESLLRNTRENWLHLRDLFDAYEVPATWAVTGHLFLDSCPRCHRDHPAGERCCQHAVGDLEANDVWCADELVGEIADAAVDHEIGGHGFTHVHLEHERMSEEFAAREIENCTRAAAQKGYDLSSFVFPVNRVRHRDLLAEHGFECYRGVNRLLEERGTIGRQLTKVSSAVVGKPTPPIVEPHVDEYGLVNVPASIYLFNFGQEYEKPFAALGKDPVLRQVKAGIDEVAETDGVLHLWLHPHNLRTPAHHRRLRSIVRHIDRRRESSDLRVDTMGGIADDVRRAERSRPVRAKSL